MASFIGRRLITIVIFIVHGHLLNAQFKQIFIKDKQTKESLAYATVLVIKESKVLYTDSIGTLFLEEKIIQQNDSIQIGFINYKELILTGKDLASTNQIFLERSYHQLKEIIVNDCKEEEIFRITDKYGSIRAWNGAGFDMPVKLLGYYPNETGKEGWLTSLEFYASSVKQSDAKLRVHWYEWDEKKQEPGNEITDTNIIVSVLKNGLNEIKIPAHSIYVSSKGIVLGFDMIYTSDIFKTYKEMQNDVEARTYRFKYNWFLGMDIHTKSGGFVLHKNQILSTTNKKDKFRKPAVHLYIKTCMQ